MSLPRDAAVLVPAYHCATAIEPVLRAGCRIRYYNVRRDCSVDLDDVRSKLGDDVGAILAVHYFGLQQDLGVLRSLCDERSVYLLEDCAHCLGEGAPERPLGSTGDVSVFSLRKFFPVFDGGLLWINNPALHGRVHVRRSGWGLRLKALKSIVEKLAPIREHRSDRSPAKRSREDGRMRAKTVAAVTGRDEDARINPYDLTFDPATADLEMTPVSRYVVRCARTASVLAARRENFAKLVELSDELPGIEPLYERPADGVGSWVAPLLAPSIRDLHRKLRDRGIPAAAWDGVVHPTLDTASFPDAEFLYHHLLFLPCHQSLTPDHVTRMVSVLRDVVAEGAR